MYRRKIEIFTTWIRAKRPVAYDSENEKIILPLNADVIVEFMAKISIVSDRKTGTKSFGHRKLWEFNSYAI